MLIAAGKIAEAKKFLWETAREIVGPDFQIPGIANQGDGGVRNYMYATMKPWERANLAGCCNGLAECFMKEGNLESALAWTEETRVLHKNSTFTSPKDLYDWIDFNLDFPALTEQIVRGMDISSQIYLRLGNTGSAVHRRWCANASTVNLPKTHQTSALKRYLNIGAMPMLIELRHPDPRVCAKAKVTNVELQVRGSWLKLDAKDPQKKMARFGFASFIWNKHLYVAGGRKDSLGPFYRDIMRLNLENPDTWEQLPPYPVPEARSSAFLGWSMLVKGDRAYLFTGRPEVDYFDLVSNAWGSFQTTYTATDEDIRCGITKLNSKWPYPGNYCTDATMQIINNKLYVFGGTHGKTNIGCNLFMALDLETKEWTRLSGFVMPPVDGDFTQPGPRKTPTSWPSPDGKRFHLLYGQCDREGAALSGELHGANRGYAFEDMWSWGIEEGSWKRERFMGNPPCPRSEHSTTYNEKLGKVFVFGGYHPSLPTDYADRTDRFAFSYYADTFMYDMPTSSNVAKRTRTADQAGIVAPKWKQVLTRGFPTYRCQAHLLTCPDTGRMYLYGGFTNKDFISGKKSYNSRSFHDIWELRVDIPGGHFEGVDLEEESRTAQAGPLQRCFNCGNAGRWKKCGGTCNGKAFFCSPDCLKEGWKDHKTMHHCRKAD
ncbi:hypothetical protein BDN72DRAFT_802956 [Pluteus cervinus]|uniref:Uncharacterized protein n=1 Tax=Pluteus cervinus TaxID=181527 RepID=A0ACD3ADH1_9AGAR|nr:hypothetical protein BDN72DRAFT_802956 [Pluteus cervinus]